MKPTRMSSDHDQCCMDDSDDGVFRASTESDSDSAVFRPGNIVHKRTGRKTRQQSNGHGPPIIVYILGSKSWGGKGATFQTARFKAFGEDCGLKYN